MPRSHSVDWLTAFNLADFLGDDSRGLQLADVGKSVCLPPKSFEQILPKIRSKISLLVLITFVNPGELEQHSLSPLELSLIRSAFSRLPQPGLSDRNQFLAHSGSSLL